LSVRAVLADGSVSPLFFFEMPHHIISSTLVPQAQRTSHTKNLFAIRWYWIEEFAFDTATSLSPQYDGGLWDFFSLSNGGFFMAPASTRHFHLACANGYEGTLTADAFGVTCSLYAYSMLSFSSDAPFGELCARHYHLLRDYALQHAEAVQILQAID
jgi:hypothetical protein